MGPINCPQTSVRNCHSTLHKIPKGQIWFTPRQKPRVTPTTCVLHYMRDPVSHPYKTTEKMIFLFFFSIFTFLDKRREGKIFGPNGKPGPRSCVIFRNMLISVSEQLLDSLRTPNLENHDLWAVHDGLFNSFAATTSYLEAISHTRNLRTPHAVVCRYYYRQHFISDDEMVA